MYVFFIYILAQLNVETKTMEKSGKVIPLGAPLEMDMKR